MLDTRLVEEAMILTFEEMAFLDVAPGPSEAPVPSEGPWLYLAYSRPTTGSFALFLPRFVKFQVAEAIYGADAGTVSSAQLDDSLLEVMNVLAGRLLTNRFGPESTYVMGLPTLLYDKPEEQMGFQRQEFAFHADDNDIALLWYEVVP